MTQEYIMKRRMIHAIIFALITGMALAVFIGLYIDETHRVQETYRTQFIANLSHTLDSVDSYLDAEGDLELRYRVIVSTMSSTNSFAFLLDALPQSQKIAVNELHTCLLKYPQQMTERERMEEMRAALSDVKDHLDKGYEEMQAIVDAIDKKGY